MSPKWMRRQSRPRLLGVLLCYNDAEILEDAVRYLREQGHHVIAWDHGSTDDTAEVLRRLRPELLELQTIPRDFDFYQLYPTMSEHLLATYVKSYDWISWPDQDEFLEGPDRSRSYQDWVGEVFHSRYDWIQFNNFNYWWTGDDDPAIESDLRRVRHYSLFPDCAPRIRSWRATSTNRREFNHNPPLGEQYPQFFNLRHYPMRSESQMTRRIEKDRNDLQRADANYHYENMKRRYDQLTIPSDRLHFDDGTELKHDPIFNWRSIYGYGPEE
ncbi:MAG: glycosyltransferase family 2 protein [Acidimicrobiales bacterium]